MTDRPLLESCSYDALDLLLDAMAPPVEDTHRNGNGGRSPAPVRPQSIDSGAIPVVLAPPPVNHAREESSKPAKVMSLDMD